MVALYRNWFQSTDVQLNRNKIVTRNYLSNLYYLINFFGEKSPLDFFCSPDNTHMGFKSPCLQCHVIPSRLVSVNISINTLHMPNQLQSLLSPVTTTAGNRDVKWWRHEMETFCVLLAICAGNSPVTDEFPAQRPVKRSFDVFFDLDPNKRLTKSGGLWLETPTRPLWRHCNE